MISAVILTKNEEKNIGECLKSLNGFSEILVVDDDSTDKTREIAASLGAKVFTNPLSDFSKQRNFALPKAKSPWVLFIDADERVPEKLQKEIQDAVKENSANGFYFKRNDLFLGRWLKHGETASTRLLRLAKKESGIWKGKVHETWEVKGPKKTLETPLLHFPHPTIHEFLEDINRYSSLRAFELYQKKKKTTILHVFLYPTMKFLQNYFLRLGILDGQEGFVMAAMMSLHSFLVRSKLYLYHQGIKENLKNG